MDSSDPPITRQHADTEPVAAVTTPPVDDLWDSIAEAVHGTPPSRIVRARVRVLTVTA